MMQPYAETLVPPTDPPPPGSSLPEPDSDLEIDVRKATRVLVVDDESTIVDTLVEILNGEGYQAVGVSTAESAIPSAKIFRPHIVISDVVLPGANGIEAAIKIRELLPKCRIILFSGQTATVDLLREARERGHEFEIVAKPIKPKALLSLIRRR